MRTKATLCNTGARLSWNEHTYLQHQTISFGNATTGQLSYPTTTAAAILTSKLFQWDSCFKDREIDYNSFFRNFDDNIKFLIDIYKPLTDQLVSVGVKLQLSHQYTHYSSDLQTPQESRHFIIPLRHSCTQYATDNSSIWTLIMCSVSTGTLKLCED